jgi:hypothetical protein
MHARLAEGEGLELRQSRSTTETREWLFPTGSTRSLFQSAIKAQVIGNGKYPSTPDV